jgi:hypothetical protein
MSKKKKTITVENSEKAMIEGILEGSPEAVGVVVIRLDCGCRKMAAIAKDGEPASKIIMYRNAASSICEQCKDDNGAFMRVTESLIHWEETELTDAQKDAISVKVLGSQTAH